QLNELQSELTQKNQELEKIKQEQSEELFRALQNAEIEFKNNSFAQVKRLLIYYPSAIKIIETKPNIPAKSLISLLNNLDKLLVYWGYQTIGKPGERVKYNPEYHQTDDETIQPGESVYIRFVGYQQETTIVTPAKVSRNFLDL
ncbi:hypothetical protein, partial [Gloeocapsa sp. PCC 73106]|uniref:hypothetical protein n=1 Tax=Gloeocapsa sp. PCC 73106 TaxID=102232 RepID=UPI0002AC75A3